MRSFLRNVFWIVTDEKIVLSAVLSVVAVSTSAAVPSADEMRGPFPIMSTPYFEDGAVDYEGLKREAAWVVRCGSPGAIWCQSNDAIDLLTTEEKFRGFEACAAAFEGADTVLAFLCAIFVVYTVTGLTTGGRMCVPYAGAG